MKAIKFMAMLLAAATLTFGAASCGDDDDEKGGLTAENINWSKVKVQFTESDLQLELKITYEKYEDTEVAKFSRGGAAISGADGAEKQLIAWTETMTFPSSSEAKKSYQEMLDACDELVDMFVKEGLSKEEAQQMAKEAKKEIEETTTVSGNKIITNLYNEQTAWLYTYGEIKESMLEDAEEMKSKGASFEKSAAAAIARKLAVKVVKK